jgi:FkbM family methyltransferase
MKDFENFNFGPIEKDQRLKELIINEIFIDNLYEKIFQVKKGDIVVDIGASTGPFTYSILHKNPKHVFCIEPSKTEFKCLISNTLGNPVSYVNKAIWPGDGLTNNIPTYFDSGFCETIKFSTFVKDFGLESIDFLKTDSEGGEYYIFTDENIDFLLNKVGCIVGEWHLGDYTQKNLFRDFRNKYLGLFKTVRVFSVDGVDIGWDLWNDNFIDYYQQVLFHISNKE